MHKTWGHKSEVIQVRCIEIKLKVENNNNGRQERRSAGTKTTESWFIQMS